MKKVKKSFAILAFTGIIGVSPVISTFATAIDDGISIGGLSFYLNQYYKEEKVEEAETLLLSTDIVIPEGIAIANVNDYVNIRENPGTEHTIVGILTKDAACIVMEITNTGWALIKSGNITGYILSDYLFTGEAGRAKALEVAKLTATVTAGIVNVRSNPSTEAFDNIITEVTKGEELEVVDLTSKELLTKHDKNAVVWAKVVIDNVEGYVTREFVDISYTWKYASKPVASTKSTLRNTIINEAKKYLGLRYVWGGESLVTGADCSGFVRAIYKKCGINISKLDRTSAGMASQKYGRSVSLANAQPGDLVFYGDTKGNVNHVAMYIGNGQVIHESGYSTGCKISNVNYRTILKIKNFLD